MDLSRFDADPNDKLWLDRPLLGFNRNWVVVSFNVATTNIPATFDHARFYVFNKTNLYSGGTTHTVFDRPAGNGGSFAPAQTYDNEINQLYLAQTITEQGVRRGRIWTINWEGSAPGLSSLPGTKLEGIKWWEPYAYTNRQEGFNTIRVRFPSAPQADSAVKIETNDDRMDSVVVRGGSIWLAHTVFFPQSSPTNSAIQWFEFSIDENRTVQRGLIEDTTGAVHYAYPSIAVNQFNDVLIGFTRFSTTTYPSAAYTFRADSDPVNTLRNPYVYKSGAGIFKWGSSHRWGDYSATVVDPNNDIDFWTLQEYSETPVGTDQFSGRWGTWWAKVAPPAPANDNFSAAFQLTGATGSTNSVIYRATREAGEPNHAGNSTYTRSIWYTWTAPANGNVTFNIAGSSPSVTLLMAAYTGSALNSLTPVASRQSVTADGRSNLFFNAVNGTTYRIALAIQMTATDGYDDVVLNWSQPSAPAFVLDPDPAVTNIVSGNPLVLASLAIGNPAPSYYWFKDATNLISGATFANYTNSSIQLSDQGTYRVVASNYIGMSTSLFSTVWTYTNSAATLSAINFINNELNAHISGVTTHTYRVEMTLDWTNWVSVHTNNASFDYNTGATNPFAVFRVIKQ